MSSTKSRRKALVQKITASNVDAVLLNADSNIRYLTGFPACDAWLLVTQSNHTYYITDSRYTLEARKALPDIKVIEFKSSFYQTLVGLLNKHKIDVLGIDESHYTVTDFKRLKKSCGPTIKIKPANHWIEDLRVCKDANEVKAIKQSLKLHKKTFKFLKKTIKSGQTEHDILLALEAFVRGEGAGFSFDPIVASGPNSCLPHAVVSRRKIRKNDVVLVDMGIDLNGYKSDLTRMFFLGKIPALVRRTNDIVYQAQREAIKHIKPGVSAQFVDQQARKYLQNHKLDKFFGHSLGHGVGLDIHENPRLSPQSSTILESGMVITVEPGVYLPDQFGIRIEDMVLVTANGCEILSDHIN